MARAATLTPRWNLPSNYYDYAGYAAMHLACLGVLWTGVTWKAVGICVLSYVPRMFGLIAGYHRYFAHRSYRMPRAVQFAMAFLGTLAVQKGVLWWSEYHRHHHRFSDEPEDVHSPIQRSFLYSHSGWFLDERHRNADHTKVPDLAAYPELVWLNDWNLIPAGLFAVILYLTLGLDGLVWGFFVSTILIWHAIHSIGSFGHRFGGYRRYPTSDNSRNKWFLAIVTLGEGWHNNHHYYPASARQGFFWYEYDLAWYLLKAMSWVGLVSELKVPPEHVRKGELLPGYQRRLQDFQKQLMDFRRELETVVEGPLGEVSDEDARDRIIALRQWIADRVDLFHEAAYSLLVEGPLAMLEAFDDLRSDILEMASRTLPQALSLEDAERAAGGLRQGFEQFAERPEFLGKAAA